MTTKKQTILELGPMDAAIILRADGTLEAALPELDMESLPENIVTSAALMFALQSPKMYDLIHENFIQECATMDLDSANDD